VLAACGGQTTLPVSGSPEPLALFVRPAAAPTPAAFDLYDRHGAFERDLAAGLDLGDLTGIRVSAGGQVMTARGPDLSARLVVLATSRPPGLTSTLGETQLVVRAARPSGIVRLLGLALDGRRTFDLDLPAGEWDFAQASPGGRYVFLDDAQRHALVVDTAASRVIWTGQAVQAVFTSDDSRLVTTTPDHALHVRALPDGADQRFAPPADLAIASASVAPVPQAATPDGVILAGLGDVTFGEFLWHMSWDGTFTPLDPGLTRFSDDHLYGFSAGGRVAVFALEPRPDHPEVSADVLGYDLVQHTTQPYHRAPGIYGGDRMYALDGQHVSTWTLEDATPRALDEVPAVPQPWLRQLGATSADGRVILVETAWGANRAPDGFPADGTLVSDDRGARLLTLPVGAAELDRTGAILLLGPADPARRGHTLIGDIGGHATADVSEAGPAAIVYRP
jgi:hypothetical protein